MEAWRWAFIPLSVSGGHAWPLASEISRQELFVIEEVPIKSAARSAPLGAAAPFPEEATPARLPIEVRRPPSGPVSLRLAARADPGG
jgi:hypothetical protein